MNNEFSAEYLICEAPVCVGSPTSGTQHAYSYLKNNGLKDLLCKKAVFCDFEGEREFPEKKPDERLKGLCTVMHINCKNYENMLFGHTKGLIPICLGGDHSLAMSSIAALADFIGADNTAVIYIDGHTDINTAESSVTGYIHGMPLSQALGLCPDVLNIGKNKVHLLGENLYIIGARSIDPPEYGICKEQKVNLYTADCVKSRGWKTVINEVLQSIGNKKIHLSFDVDCIDGSEFPYTGYVMPNGLSYDCVYGMLKEVIDRGISSMDIVEYNPSLDKTGDGIEKLLEIFKLL